MRHLLLSILFSLPLFSAEYPAMGEDIYDVNADAKIEIANAMILAKAQNKHVMLDFGTNWSIWCHRFNHTLHADPESVNALTDNYIWVSIDTNTRNGTNRNLDVVSQYSNPTRRGLPVLVVLDSDGEVLITQGSSSLKASAVHDAKLVRAFLERWAPKS